jgi:hypothetical protein
MILKRTLCQERVRKPPAGFNWLDHRLVRDRYIEECSHQAAALYLFLVTVSDAQGLSYYSDTSLMKRLSMGHATLAQARANLEQVGLIAYQKPLYQVLALDGTLAPAPKTTVIQPSYGTGRKRKSSYSRLQPLNQILKQILENPHD